jgi:hypothetical protein
MSQSVHAWRFRCEGAPRPMHALRVSWGKVALAPAGFYVSVHPGPGCRPGGADIRRVPITSCRERLHLGNAGPLPLGIPGP